MNPVSLLNKDYHLGYQENSTFRVFLSFLALLLRFEYSHSTICSAWCLNLTQFFMCLLHSAELRNVLNAFYSSLEIGWNVTSKNTFGPSILLKMIIRELKTKILVQILNLLFLEYLQVELTFILIVLLFNIFMVFWCCCCFIRSSHLRDIFSANIRKIRLCRESWKSSQDVIEIYLKCEWLQNVNLKWIMMIHFI